MSQRSLQCLVAFICLIINSLLYAQQEVAVTKTAGGTITSEPAGIDCGDTCAAIFEDDTTVTLTATLENGFTSIIWNGDCSSTGETVTLTTDSAKNCTAIFVEAGQQALFLTKSGEGTITSEPSGIDCGETCSVFIGENTDITLTANPATGWIFESWSGDCSGTEAMLTLTMDSAKNCSATFTEETNSGTTPTTPEQFNLTLTKTGAGTITSNPSGINCSDLNGQSAVDKGL